MQPREPGRVMRESWTYEQKCKIVADYRRAHIARCPTDRSLLTVCDSQTGTEPDDNSSNDFIVECPTCHQRFFSASLT